MVCLSLRLLYLHDGGHGEGVLLSESKMRVVARPGKVKKGHCRVRGVVGVSVSVLNNPELVEASLTGQER